MNSEKQTSNKHYKNGKLNNIRIGLVAFARQTFDYQTAEGIYDDIIKKLNTLEQVEVVAVPKLVIEIEDAQKAAKLFQEKDIHGLVCISATFHLGHLVLELDKRLQVPILLWGLPELPYDGGKIRLNSVCGVNLNASNLYKSGVRTYHAHIGADIDSNWLSAIKVKHFFQEAHIGLAGFRAHGFFNLGTYDLNIYNQMGILLDHYELADIWNIEVHKDDIEKRRRQLSQIFDISGISAKQVDLTAALAAKLDHFMLTNNLDGLALRCWPEHADCYGISPCGAMSLLQSEGRIITCEGDVEGCISMGAHAAAGGETPYLIDFSQFNFAENYALLWHCGVAPCNLWDGTCNRSLDTYFAGGRGVTADFVLKKGPVSLLRIDSAGTDYRLFLQQGEVVPMEKELKGTYGKVIFNRPIKDVLYTVIDNGIAHHASMVYGNYIEPFRITAKIQNWKVIE